MKWWLRLPAELSHGLAAIGTRLYSLIELDKETPVCNPLTWKNLYFKNRWGIAGGVDKNADNVRDWWNLGCGFVEVGTVTLKPQSPNSGKIMDRSIPHEALWNRMGFPGEGVNEVIANLQLCRPFRTPVFVNIGKSRTTTDAEAPSEYFRLFLKFRTLADALVINISSPNTVGLRTWLEPAKLKSLIAPIAAVRIPSDPALLLKLSPDQTDEELKTLMLTAWELGVEGFILTNTTLSREGGLPFPPEGGASGAPLRGRSEQCLKLAVELFKSKSPRPLIVSVGGVMTADDVFARLKMGADLVQCYSALVYQGPRFFKHIARKWDNDFGAKKLIE
ncbi:MAG: quinone-dependent dihydroorotate dehydrogenase [Bdellovibrionota bacterium]